MKRPKINSIKNRIGVYLISLLCLFCLSGCVRYDYSYEKTENSGIVEQDDKEDVNVSTGTGDLKASVETEQKVDIKQGVEVKQTVNIKYKFRNKSLLNEHFDKHGQEFPYKTAEEYLEGANRVLASEGLLHKKEKEDNDDVYYLEATNEFIIVSGDGYIRTYFKPRRGIDYYNSQ